MKYSALIKQGRESRFVAYFPALKGCVSQGETKEDALKNIKDTVELEVTAK